MLYWVFDLDYTLYSLPKSIGFSYDLLKKDEHVNTLLRSFPLKKEIFTNGTLQHAFNALKKMEMYNIFNRIEARDTLGGLKPNPVIFLNFIQKGNIQPNDVVVFFEDTLENLKVAKEFFNWKTVYIYSFLKSDYKKPYFVDFVFPNINTALEYFYIKFNMKEM